MKKMQNLIADELTPIRSGHVGRVAKDKVWLASYENDQVLYKLEGLHAEIFYKINGEKSFLIIYLEVQQEYEVSKNEIFAIFEAFEKAGIILIKENST